MTRGVARPTMALATGLMALLAGCSAVGTTVGVAGTAVATAGSVVITGISLTGRAIGAGVNALSNSAKPDNSGIVIRERIRDADPPSPATPTPPLH